MIRSNMGDLQQTFYLVYSNYGFVKQTVAGNGIRCSMDIEQAAIIRDPSYAEECAREAINEFGTAVIFELPGGKTYEVT